VRFWPGIKNKLTVQEIEHWDKYGFVVLKKCFSKAQMSNARQFLEQIWLDRPPLTIDAFLGTKHPQSGVNCFPRPLLRREILSTS
jgi:hypothetical protein